MDEIKDERKKESKKGSKVGRMKDGRRMEEGWKGRKEGRK